MATHVEHVMGMAVSIDIRDADQHPEAVAEVVAWLHLVDATFSTYQDSSEISRLARGDARLEDLSPDVGMVLRRCIELQEMTDGAFDVFAVLAPNGMRLDPSGFVKGWAVEVATGLLERAGVRSCCINVGGDIALRGDPGPGELWRVGIRHPGHPDALAAVVRLSGPAAVATSGTYERGAHIIDPATGEPTTAVASATVVGPDLGTADAFATAVFVKGVAGVDWIEAHPGYATFVIDHGGRTWRSSRLAPALDGDGLVWSRCGDVS